jgi:uroporphyrinogen-III decarboxylase
MDALVSQVTPAGGRRDGALSSRERLLRALDRRPADRIPCCFMSFTALRRRVGEDLVKLAKAERRMGLDAMLFIPSAPRPRRPDHPYLRGLPVRFNPEVKTVERRERDADGSDILYKTYVTPAGELSTAVRRSADWPHGDHIPFVDDYQVPRALRPLVAGPEDLPALRYLLTPPSEDDAAPFADEARKARAFAEREDVLLAGGWGIGMDMANWLCGMQDLMVHMMDRPAFVAELLEMIHAWNVRRMETVLSAPVDLYIRRAWYEGCDFVTPRFFREAVLPFLKAEADLAHRRGTKFGYICSSGTKPMIDYYLDAGIDVLIGVDPVQGTHTDLPLLRRRFGGRVCLWGGVSGAVTVERGTEEEVRAAVRAAIETLGPDGFILSPIDNITVDDPRTWRNLDVFIDEWRKRG